MNWPTNTRSIVLVALTLFWASTAFAQVEMSEAKPEGLLLEGPVEDGSTKKARNNPRANKSGRGNATKPKSEIKIELPDNKKPVLVMDSKGGFRMQLPKGFQVTPMLQIFADGRVLTGRKSPLVKEVEGHIDSVDLKALLVFIADDCHFFELTSERVKADIQKKRNGQLMDAATTEFMVNLKDHSNSVELYALPLAAEEFAEVPSVASLIAIASRCRRIVAMTRLGSEEEASAALNFVNQEIGKKESKAPLFTMEHLQFAEQFVDGRRNATFTQNFNDGGQPTLAYATWQVDAKGEESVSIHTAPQRRR